MPVLWFFFCYFVHMLTVFVTWTVVCSGDRYHLFNHNCNTFSNEVANFLTGHSIPSRITNLPQEVLQT